MPQVATRTLKEYQVHLLGYPVVLRDVVIERTYPDGTVTHEIPDQSGLISAMAVARALYPLQLTPTEIKFLRKAMGKTGVVLAEDMEVSPETISRWEKDQGMGGFAAKLLRDLVLAELKEKAPGIPVPEHAVTRMKVKRRIEGDEAMPVFEFRRLPMILGQGKFDAWDCLSEAA